MSRERFVQASKQISSLVGNWIVADEKRRKHVARVSVEALKIIGNRRMDVDGMENVRYAKDLLENNSALVTFNHLSIYDMLPICLTLRKGFPADTHFMFPTSQVKFFEGLFESDTINDMVHAGAAAFNMELLPVKQHGSHLSTDEAHIIENTDKRSYLTANYEVLTKMKKSLAKPGNVVVMAQEGGRSRTGSMIKAERPIDFYVRKSRNEINENSFVLPLSLWGTENVHRIGEKTLHPFEKVNVVVGEPMMTAQLYHEADSWGIDITTLASLHSARNLPQQYRGYYDEHRFPEFFAYYNT